MRAEVHKGFEIRWNGDTVWIAGPDGGTLGRFSKWGMDIHKHTQAQLETGSACEHCTHELPKLAQWMEFLSHFYVSYGIQIPDMVRPRWLPVTVRLDLTGPKKRPPPHRRRT